VRNEVACIETSGCLLDQRSYQNMTLGKPWQIDLRTLHFWGIEVEYISTITVNNICYLDGKGSAKNKP
jgi:hypothetical protein